MSASDHEASPQPQPTTMSASDHEASPQPQPNKWGPYANAGDFTANMFITLSVVLCGLLLGLAINTVTRFFICSRRQRAMSEDLEKHAGASKAVTSLPMLFFSTAGTQLIGAECAICLADFVDGDGIRVLPDFNHGFHAQCVDRWLAARPSCRVSCHVASVRS